MAAKPLLVVLAAGTATFIASLALGVLEGIASTYWPAIDDSAIQNLLLLIDSIVGFLAAAAVVSHGYRRILLSNFDPDPRWMIHCATGMIVGALGYYVVEGLLMISENILPASSLDRMIEEMIRPPSSATDAVLLLVSVCLVTPVAEELVFRGMFYRLLRQQYGILSSVCISSVIFVVFHPVPLWIPHLLFANALFCLGFEHTKSVVFPISAHGVMNLLALIGYLVQR